jgi:hypothetical protein
VAGRFHTLPPAGAVLLPPRLNAEFGHVHTDGSLHLVLSQEDQRELVAKGCGHALLATQN